MATHKDGPTRGLRLPCGNVKHHFVIHQTEHVRLKGIEPHLMHQQAAKPPRPHGLGGIKQKFFYKKSERIYRVTLCDKRR